MSIEVVFRMVLVRIPLQFAVWTMDGGHLTKKKSPGHQSPRMPSG